MDISHYKMTCPIYGSYKVCIKCEVGCFSACLSHYTEAGSSVLHWSLSQELYRTFSFRQNGVVGFRFIADCVSDS